MNKVNVSTSRARLNIITFIVVGSLLVGLVGLAASVFYLLSSKEIHREEIN